MISLILKWVLILGMAAPTIAQGGHILGRTNDGGQLLPLDSASVSFDAHDILAFSDSLGWFHLSFDELFQQLSGDPKFSSIDSLYANWPKLYFQNTSYLVKYRERFRKMNGAYSVSFGQPTAIQPTQESLSSQLLAIPLTIAKTNFKPLTLSYSLLANSPTIYLEHTDTTQYKRASVLLPNSGDKISVFLPLWKDNRTAALSLSFDDGFRSYSEVLFPLLESFGLKATFYIITAPLGRPNKPAQWRYGDWSQFQDMDKAGQEIGSHTYSHLSLATLPIGDTLTPKTLVYELAESRHDLLVHFPLQKIPFTLGYPFEEISDREYKYVANYYWFLRHLSG